MNETIKSTTLKPKNESQKISFGYACLLGFIFSIIVSPNRLFPSLEPLHLQDLLVIGAFFGVLWKLRSGELNLKPTSVELAYALFIMLTGFSLLNLRPYDVLADGMLQYQISLKTIIVLILISSYSSSPRMFRKGFYVFILAIIIFQLHGLNSVIHGVGMSSNRFDSWIGLISNSDNVGAFLTMTLPIQLELFVYLKKRWKSYLMSGFVLINIVLLVLTQTRSAFLSFIIIFVLWTIRKKNRLKRFSVALLIFFTMIISGLHLSRSTEYENFFARMHSIFSTEAYETDSNIQSRFYFWNQGMEIWRLFPIIGCGVGGMDIHETLTHSDIGRGYTQGMSLTRYSLHQTFIQLLAERGLLGMGAYIFFLWTILRTNYKNALYCQARPSLQFHYFVSRGMSLSILAFIINAMFMTITESWILIIMAGFIAGLYKIRREDLKQKALAR